MGRTLHYQVLNPDQLTDAHLETLPAVSEAYNTGHFAKVWTCENFYFDPLDSSPNWKSGQNWPSYNKRYAELETQGFSPLAIRRQLVAEGAAKCVSDELRGFTKVGGNEFNALLVYSALLRITELTPARITLYDEGEFLLASLILQQGKAKLDLKDMETSWYHWDKQGFLAEDRYGCRTKLEAQQALFRKYGTKLQEPETFCRPVKAEDFLKHPEYNAGEKLNGDLNPFDESMHVIAHIHSLLGEGMTLQLAKKLP